MNPLLSAPLRVLLTALGLGATVLPRRAELTIGPALGRLVRRLGLFKVKRAAEHIALCFPEKTPEEREALLVANYEHYGILLFEFMHFFSPVPGHYRRYAARVSRLVGREHWEAARAKGKGVLFFSSHMGWWEMSAAAGGLAGVAPTVVTTVLKPEWLDAMITEGRSSCGITAAYHPGSMPSVMRVLRKGGSVAFMNDQYAPPPMGAPVPFFGALVNTLTVVGPLAKRTGAAVVPVSVERDEHGVNVVTMQPEFDLSAAKGDAAASTTLIAARVEEWVRRRPAQWLWIHRRFKNAAWNRAAP